MSPSSRAPLLLPRPRTLPSPPKKKRTWTDVTGKFKIEGAFVKKDGDQVELRRTDGKTVKLPAAKLCEADQKYIEELVSKQAENDAENPFKTVDDDSENPFKSDGPRKGAMPRPGAGFLKAPSDAPPFSGVAESNLPITPLPAKQPHVLILTPPSGYSFTPDPSPAPPAVEIPSVSVALSPLPASDRESGNRDFFEEPNGIYIDESGKKALVGLHDPRHSSDSNPQRFEWIDLEKGEALGSFNAPARVYGIHFDPASRLLLAKETLRGAGERVDLWSVGESDLSHQLSFLPGGLQDRVVGKQVKWARLVDADHLLTVTGSLDSSLVLWKTNPLTPLYSVSLTFQSTPALSASKKYLAISANTGIYVIETLTGKVIAKLPGDIGYSATFAFSPSGEKLACVTMDRLLVWDLKNSGQLVSEVYFPTPFSPEEVIWPSEDLVGVKAFKHLRLIDPQKQVVLWNYALGECSAFQNGRVWSIVRHNRGAFSKVLTHAAIPHAAVREMQASLANQDLLVLKPGSSVSVFINVALGEPERVQIYNHILEQLKEAGINVDQNSTLSIEAATEKGESETVKYGDVRRSPLFGPSQTATATKLTSRITIRDNGKVIWQAQQIAGAPPLVRLGKGQSVQDAVNAATSPNVDFFLGQKLPRRIARHPDSGAYGSSQFTAQGLK